MNRASSPRYADQAWHGTVAIRENVPLARDTYRVRLEAPEIARPILPGQFLMLRLPGSSDPILGRPLALYDVVRDESGAPPAIDIVYLTLGRMTRRLAALGPRDALEAWGPLGGGFPAEPAEHLLMVAGGIGQTPFLALAREYLGLSTYGDPPRHVPRAKRVTLLYGTKTWDYLAGVEDFERAGVEVVLSTEDGSAGQQGVVTQLIEPTVKASPHACRIVCCGPEPMMEAAGHVAERLGLPCQVSLESPMACGLGICFSCVARIRDGKGGWDYRRTCVDGPVFDARDVVW